MADAERVEKVSVSIKSLYETVKDFASYPQFVTGVKRTQFLESKAEGLKKVLFDLEMIKPISYIINVREFYDEQKGLASVSWELESSDFITKNNGGWQFKALSANETEVTYRLDVEFRFPVPGFILKNLIKTTLPQTIKEFSQRAMLKG